MGGRAEFVDGTGQHAATKPPHGLLSLLFANEVTRHATAGAAAAAASCIVTCPLDVVKARLQHSPQLAGPMEAIASSWATGGVRALYRGLGASLACYVPSWAVYFATYRAARSAGALPMPASIVAGVASTVVTNPLWVVRARIVARPDPLYPTMRAGLLELLRPSLRLAVPRAARTGGSWLANVFTGLGPSLLGVTNVAIQLPLYEHLKLALVDAEHARATRRATCVCCCCRGYKTEGRSKATTIEATSAIQQTFISASSLRAPSSPPPASAVLAAIIVAKLIATTVTYPHEVVRTRMQAGLGGIGMRASAAEAIRGSGGSILRGLYRGLATNMLRTVPGAAVVFYVYEHAAYVLDGKFGLKD